MSTIQLQRAMGTRLTRGDPREWPSRAHARKTPTPQLHRLVLQDAADARLSWLSKMIASWPTIFPALGPQVLLIPEYAHVISLRILSVRPTCNRGPDIGTYWLRGSLRFYCGCLVWWRKNYCGLLVLFSLLCPCICCRVSCAYLAKRRPTQGKQLRICAPAHLRKDASSNS